MTAREVARAARCARSTVDLARRSGELPALPLGRRTFVYRHSDAMAWIAARTPPAGYVSVEELAQRAGIGHVYTARLLVGHGQMFGKCIYFPPIVVAEFLRERGAL